MSFLSRTDSTMSGIPGPGRTVGELLQGAGRRLEPVLDRVALGLIGTLLGSYVLRTPNRARLVIDQVHIETLRRSWTKFADPKTGLVKRSNLARLLSVSSLCSVSPHSPYPYHLLQDLRGDLEVRINPAAYCLFNFSLHLSFSSERGLKLDDNPEFPSQAEVRERRDMYIQLYHEARAFCPERGYTFAQMLLLLTHYKSIVATQTFSYVYSLSASIQREIDNASESGGLASPFCSMQCGEQTGLRGPHAVRFQNPSLSATLQATAPQTET
jgi:hypothetical protein